MSKASIKSKLEFDIKISIELTLSEAKALKEITGYGHKSFLEGYYKQLGKSYLQPHEKGVISLFETIKQTLPNELHKADKYIAAINQVAESLNKEE